MNRTGRAIWLASAVVVAGVLFPGAQHKAAAQFGPLPNLARFELAEAVQLDRADTTVMADLERVKAHLDARQWDEAVETLRRVLENSEQKLVGVTPWRYVSLRDYCHLQVAGLPAEALKLYRSRVDPVARRWYEEGVAKRDRRLLAKVVEQAFASSWGDDALMALGEMALEQADYTSARWYWERIIPARLPAGAPRTWPGFPDTDLDLAAVRARLVLVSILEGSPERARDELTQFVRLHPDAQGRLGGREVNYAEALGAMLAESTTWPQAEASPDWPTFAGSPQRNKRVPQRVDLGKVAWRVPLPEVTTADLGVLMSPEGRKPVPRPTLSYHPVSVGDLVLVNDPVEIKAINVHSGRPAWGEAGSAIYRDELEGVPGVASQPAALGARQFTMTVFEDKLYARMGSSVTNQPQAEAGLFSRAAVGRGYLVCLDLAAEGRLMWKITPEEGWAFEGSPVADGQNLYVGMRRGGLPEAHVACFDAQTGHRRWRVFVCGAETPARGVFPQNTHNLLTLDGRTLYYNTNLGAVAAISARDGRLKWVSLYPRARDGNLLELAPHWHRDLNPCLCDHGTLLVAPADSPRIFALDAATGQILWQTGPGAEDVVYLLGTTAEHLIASGDRLYWISLTGEDRGRVKHVWPDGPDKLGYGRGVLAGDCVLWPTREKIYVFDQKTARQKGVFDLVPRGATGGNLLVAGGQLLVAGTKELTAFSPLGGGPNESPEALARGPGADGRQQQGSTSSSPVSLLRVAAGPGRRLGQSPASLTNGAVKRALRVSGAAAPHPNPLPISEERERLLDDPYVPAVGAAPAAVGGATPARGLRPAEHQFRDRNDQPPCLR
jgi:outer membrane protein assembly factor BamB